MEKQMFLFFMCFSLCSCSIMRPNYFPPVPNEKLVHIQVIPQDDTASNYIQIYGCATEYKSGESLILGTVNMYKNDVFTQGTQTDFNGQFFLTSFNWDSTAHYTIEFSYLGFYTLKIDKLPLQKGFNYELECSLANETLILDGPYCPSYEVPLIELDNTTSGQIFTSEQIKHRATRGK